MGFLDQLSCLKASTIRGRFLIVAQFFLLNQKHPESATWASDTVAIIYHGSAYARELLVQQEVFYTYQFMPNIFF